MARIRSRIGRAAAAHRRAVALTEAAGAALHRLVPAPRSPAHERGVRELTEQLRIAAAKVAPGWLGASLDAVPASAPLGDAPHPRFVRVGTAQPLDDARFPVVLPLGHLAYDADCRDPRVAASLQGVLLRLLAAASAGTLLVRVVGAAGDGACRRLLAPFAPLHEAGILPPPVTDRAGLHDVLAEAERWVRASGAARTLLLVLAGWPQEAGADELARLHTLATNGPAARLHLLVAGWPPPPLGADTVAPLPHTTQISVRNPHVRVGDPPGGSFAATSPGPAGGAGLNARVYLDDPPPEDLIGRVCRAVADRAMAHARVALGDLLPTGALWTQDATGGLTTSLARPGGGPVPLRLDDRTPHWLIAGRAGSGKTTLLLALLYGLCARYGPDQLNVYLLDHSGGEAFADFVPSANDPSRLPHARVAGVRPDLEQSITVLQELEHELTERAEMMRSAGVATFAELRAAGVRLPRLVCMIDEYQPLLADAAKAEASLRTLLRQGGALGVHAVLASRQAPGAQARYGEPDAIFGRCRLRIALPGGAAVLDAANDAAAGLPLGAAVINTAGGLGGPRGATRAHEQVAHFPDPYADPVALAGLRHRLWRAAS